MNIYTGDALDILKTMDSESVHCCVTSPPYYGLRDYGIDGQIGLEETPGMYVDRLTQVFAEVRRVLRNDGTLWLNLGDSYASSTKGSGGASGIQLSNAGSRYKMNRRLIMDVKPKDLLGIPWRVAFALQADGWYLRSDIIWHKPNPMPESVTDRPTKSHEYVFLLSKSERYFYDAVSIKEFASQKSLNRRKNKAGQLNSLRMAHCDGFIRPDFGRDADSHKIWPDKRNKHSVWTITAKPYAEAHFATFPPELPRLCILAGCPEGGTVLDPFSGAGTTGLVALRLGREYIGIELNPEYVEMSQRRIINDAPLFNRIEGQQNNVLQPT
jgi:DNA modification methylase